MAASAPLGIRAMLPDSHDDELIEQLLQAEDGPVAPAENETLVNMRGDLETLKAQLRNPPSADPYTDEPDCQAAVDRIAALGSSAEERTYVDSMPSTPPAEVPSLGSLGYYRLVEKIGEGGMGAVYKAVHTKLERIVALKVLPPGRLRDQHAVNRFEREMRAVGKLQHPNIVAAHDAGEIEGTHYLVVELIKGRDLGSVVPEYGPLPIAEACEVVRQAALGLQHAHEHGLVHRDIKPSNLMLAESSHAGGAPTVKVLDLGLALLEEAHLDLAGELTSTGQVMGTIDYMAPEQGQDSHTVDIRADIYSLGATLYKLLTGRAPFAGPQYDSTLKKLMALATRQPPAVGELRPDCPPELATLVHRLLAKQPADRPQTPAEVAAMLGAFATGADLRRLLTPTTGSGTATAGVVPPFTTSNAFEETQHDASAKNAATVSGSAVRRPSARHRWLAGLGAAAVMVVVFAVVMLIQTGSGTLEIVADEGVDFDVAVLSKNVALPDGWRIKSGPNDKRIRTGAVEIRLPVDKEDEFEIISPHELVIRRNDKTVFRVVRKNRDPLVQRTQVAGGDSTLGKPVEIAEPPSLEDWLKGREVLTVAQDGSGHFKTIQSALNALQAGQVVKVLDRGPYRERLDTRDLPEDTGLVSEVDTLIEATDWKPYWTEAETGVVHYAGHYFFYISGFRVSGFTFTFPESGDKVTDGICAERADGFVLEHSWLRSGPKLALSAGFREGRMHRVGCVRECRLDEGVLWNVGTSIGGEVLIERNYFTGRVQIQFSNGDRFAKVAVRNNVCGGSDTAVFIGPIDIGACEISNNFMQADAGILLQSAPHDVTICNNLHPRAGLIAFDRVPRDRIRDAVATWSIGHNCFVRELETPENAQGFYVPKAASDVLGTPRFLSKVLTSADYARVAENDPIARQGAGGAWPDYIGPLPPGPAPKAGDWFSRMRDRWRDETPKADSEASLTPFTAEALKVPDWPRGAREPGFPGLVPQPTPIAGVHRWQMATREPRGWLENLAWSPDGKRVVTCGMDQMVRVYDSELKQLVHAWPVDRVRTVNWSTDGKLIATAGHDGRIEVWSTEDWTRRVRCQGAEGETQIVDSVVFSPDGSRLGTTIQGDLSARLWKTATGEPDGILPHPLAASDIAFSPDGRLAATSCWDAIVRLWDLDTGKVSVEYPKQSAPGIAVAFSNEGKHLVATDGSGKVIVWDVERKQQVHAWEGGGMAVASNRQGLVAAVAASAQIHVWDIATGKPAQVLLGHQYQFRQRHGIQFHPTEPVLASVAQDGELRFWNLQTGKCTGVIGPRGEDFFHIEFAPNGSAVTAAGLLTQAARIWNVADGSLRFAIKPPNCQYVRWITFSPDGSQFLTCGGDAPSHLVTTGTEDFAVRLWNTSDGSAGPVLSGHAGRVVTAAFTPDGSRVLSGGWENVIRIWNRKTGAAERVMPAVIGPGQLACSPDGKRLAGVGWPNQFQLWDLESWEPISTPAPPPEDRSARECLALHPRLPELAIAEGNRATIRSTDQGKLLREAVHGRSITVAISPDGKLLASSDDRRIQLYAYDTGEPVGKPLREPFGYCRTVAFSPDSRLLATGSADGVIRLLDLETSTCLRVWLPLTDKLSATVTTAGQLQMDPAVAEEEIIYLVQQREGAAVEVLKPSEFHERYSAVLPKPEKVE